MSKRKMSIKLGSARDNECEGSKVIKGGAGPHLNSMLSARESLCLTRFKIVVEICDNH